MNGQPINFSACSRQIKVSDQTLRDYYSILLDTYLAFELPSWTRSVRKQLTQSPRFYLFDCGILNTILGEQILEPKPRTRRFGTLFENFIITEFFKQKSYYRLKNLFYFWRTQSGNEVDLIIDRGLHAPPIAVEIKSSDEINSSDLSDLIMFKSEFPEAKLFCISRTANPYSLEGVQILPWETGVSRILKEEL